MMKLREGFETPSPVVTAPATSGITSNFSSSPSTEESKELNMTGLLMALLKLKKSPKYSESPSDIKVEQSLDGSCRIFTLDNSECPQHSSFAGSPSNAPSPPQIDHIISRLKNLAESQSENLSSPPTPTQLKKALDNCTVIYFPQNSEFSPQDSEYLPSSKEEKSIDRPYYNLANPATLRFIRKALLNRTPKTFTNNLYEEEVSESTDHSIILIHPKYSSEKSKKQFVPKKSNEEDLSNPNSVQTLMKKLRELSVDEISQQAIDDEGIRIITLEYSSRCTSGSESSFNMGTPNFRCEAPDLLSPETNFKLISRLCAVQEDAAGEEEGLVYIDTEGSGGEFSISSPAQDLSNPPMLEDVAERLRNLRSRSKSLSSDD